MNRDELGRLQALPLANKLVETRRLIREWHDRWDGQIYVSFSGGKDSTVLLNLVRQLYPDVPAVFCDTGLEYPEVRRFAMEQDNVTVIRPKMGFKEVLTKYGYPVVSKEQARFIYEVRHTKSDKLRDIRLNGAVRADGNRSRFGVLSYKWRFLLDAPFEISDKCCRVMKKEPFYRYEKETRTAPMTGEMASDSARRRTTLLENGFNAFDATRPKSAPLGFWREEDILRFLKFFGVPYCSAYGDIVDVNGKPITMGCERTGCMFCMLGVHRDRGENRFQRMRKTHPALWKYCIYELGLKEVLDYIGVPYSSIFDDGRQDR